MLTIINKNTDPTFNLALEEYVLKDLGNREDFILLWQNEPSVIIGRNQNTIEEINSAYIEKHGIHVVRRISGGGAVYHDFGNLNYTFVTDNTKDNLNNFRKFTEPVITALNNLGIPAEFAGRNDIVLEGKKISGNAQTYYQDRMFHHGTILFDADLDMVADVLKVSADKIASKGIKSSRSRVTNIRPYLKQPMDIGKFQDYLLKQILGTEDIASKTYTLSDTDLHNIKDLQNDKYRSWEWNYGRSPEFSLQKSGRYPGGKVAFYLDVKEGIIRKCTIYGDFFGKWEVSDLEKLMIGCRFEKDEIEKTLTRMPLENYFYNITAENLLSCLFE